MTTPSTQGGQVVRRWSRGSPGALRSVGQGSPGEVLLIGVPGSPDHLSNRTGSTSSEPGLPGSQWDTPHLIDAEAPQIDERCHRLPTSGLIARCSSFLSPTLTSADTEREGVQAPECSHGAAHLHRRTSSGVDQRRQSGSVSKLFDPGVVLTARQSMDVTYESASLHFRHTEPFQRAS